MRVFCGENGFGSGTLKAATQLNGGSIRVPRSIEIYNRLECSPLTTWLERNSLPRVVVTPCTEPSNLDLRASPSLLAIYRASCRFHSDRSRHKRLGSYARRKGFPL
jgi:hypothetical protein